MYSSTATGQMDWRMKKRLQRDRGGGRSNRKSECDTGLGWAQSQDYQAQLASNGRVEIIGFSVVGWSLREIKDGKPCEVRGLHV